MTTEKITIKSILGEMQETVEDGIIKSPSWWLDCAIKLSALWQNLKDEKTKAEIAYLRVVEEIMTQDNTISYARAQTKAKTKLPTLSGEVSEYQLYRYLDGRDKIVEQYIMLAKKRAQIEDV